MENLIKQGATAFKAGDVETARRLLSEAIKEYPNDESAWGWMYNVCVDSEERINCLKNIIRINPKNEKAGKILRELEELDYPLEFPAKKPESLETSQSKNIAYPSLISQKNNDLTGLSIFISLILLIGIYGIAFLIATNWNGSSSDLKFFIGLYQLGVMIWITSLALKSLKATQHSFLRFIGIYVLSLLPVAGWLVIFWASKTIAGSLNPKKADVPSHSESIPYPQQSGIPEPKPDNNMGSGVFMYSVAIIILILLFLAYIMQLSNKQAYEQSRITPVVVYTLTPISGPAWEPVQVEPTYTAAEEERLGDLAALEVNLTSCTSSAAGEFYYLKGTLTNPKNNQITDVILKGRLCDTGGV